MHRDLLNWEQALKLATRLAIEEIPYISKEYALQLEFTFAMSDVLICSVAHIVCSGQYFDALGTYERAVTNIAKVLPPHKTKISLESFVFLILFVSGPRTQRPVQGGYRAHGDPHRRHQTVRPLADVVYLSSLVFLGASSLPSN